MVSGLTLWLLMAPAFAVEVPFTPPAEVRLFTKVASVSAKASGEGDDCAGAAALALEELATKARRADAPTLISAAASGECKQTKTGHTVLNSVVSLDGLAIAEGEGMPSVTADRAVAIAATVGAPQGGLDEAELVGVDGAAFLALGPLDPGESTLTAEARAAGAFLDQVLPAMATWAGVLPALPELGGVAVDVLTDGKGKKRGALRFVVPTADIAVWKRGEIPDELLLERSRVFTSPAGKERVWAPMTVDLSTAGQSDAGLRSVDMNDADLEGLEDEESP